MYILIAIGVILLLIAGVTYYKTRILRWIFIIIGLVLVIGSSIGLNLAQHGHFLMQKNETIETHKLGSKTEVAGKSFIVTTQTKAGKFEYHYMLNGKSYRTMPANGTTRVVTGKKAQLEEKIVSYSANNIVSKFMLVGLPTSTPADSTYTFELPKDWYIISDQQNTEIQKMVDDSKAGLEDKIKDSVTKAVQDAVASNPDYLTDTNAQKQTQDDIVKQVTGEINDQLAKDVEAKLKSWNLEK
ncbi:MAG: DUF4811 domain-containing protein [Lactobacillaceae bacterium]|nr:DUF4811 domain-containing protein [Lactobacillaceae bacterium]